jgi:DNA modification methylase
MKFSLNGIDLYLGNSLEITPELNCPFHLLITDPPYQTAMQFATKPKLQKVIKGDWKHRNNTSMILEILTSCVHKLLPYRHLYVFGPVHFVNYIPFTSKPIQMIWDKGHVGLGDLELPYGPSHEVFHFCYYMPWKEKRKRGGGRLSSRLRKETVIHAPRTGAGRRHPMEKPVKLFRELIESSSCLGETIVDPFMGCGSSMVAAMLEGRKGIGIEIDPVYFETAKARIIALARKLDELPEN